MKIKVTRDEARAVQQNFFPFLQQLCDMRIRQADHDDDLLFLARLFACIFRDIKRKFDLRLVGFSQLFKIELKEHEAIVFYKLLLSVKLDPQNVWLIHLRQKLIEELFIYLSEPVIDNGTKQLF